MGKHRNVKPLGWVKYEGPFSYCEGYLNDAQCPFEAEFKHPEDGGVYCRSHRNSINSLGMNGRYLRS